MGQPLCEERELRLLSLAKAHGGPIHVFKCLMEAGREDFVSVRMVRPWHRLPKELVESPCLEILKT